MKSLAILSALGFVLTTSALTNRLITHATSGLFHDPRYLILWWLFFSLMGIYAGARIVQDGGPSSAPNHDPEP